MDRLFLFDIDGTLLMTHGAGVRGMEKAGREIFGQSFTLGGVSIAGSLDQKIYRDAMALAGLDHDESLYERFVQRYGHHLQNELNDTHHRPSEILPGVLPLLETLRQQTALGLGLLTGNYALTGPIKLRHLGIDPGWFPVAAWGDLADTRPDLVPLALEQHHRLTGRRLEGPDVVVIGDTPKDIDCAHAHGCVAVGVATGHHSLQELKDAGADLAVESLLDPGPLLDLI
ncbi:MAG: HAD family hydrolase [Phycisphaeraceae bacterium]|nr:HAD family hydrolase [Phycisphaeraceae bacterium]